MTFPQTPTRRSRRGQPVATESAQLDYTASFSTHDPVYIRETDVSRDLRDLQRQAFEDHGGHKALEGLQTKFYASYNRRNAEEVGIKREKKVYGKQQATFEEFNVGDTVLVKTLSKNPAVGVIVAITKVFCEEQERGANALVHWFSRPQDLAKLRPQRDMLEVCDTHFIHISSTHCCIWSRRMRYTIS